jgi:hypothetical protein
MRPGLRGGAQGAGRRLCGPPATPCSGRGSAARKPIHAHLVLWRVQVHKQETQLAPCLRKGSGAWSHVGSLDLTPRMVCSRSAPRLRFPHPINSPAGTLGASPPPATRGTLRRSWRGRRRQSPPPEASATAVAQRSGGRPHTHATWHPATHISIAHGQQRALGCAGWWVGTGSPQLSSGVVSAGGSRPTASIAAASGPDLCRGVSVVPARPGHRHGSCYVAS